MNLIAPDSPLADEIKPSPNHGERRLPIDMIILHYTGLREDACEAWTADPGGEALAWLCNAQAQVSSHYLVHQDGRIVQLVAEARRAWHAGRGYWRGCDDLNSCSIGIEIVNTGHAGALPPYPSKQIERVIALCKDIVARHSIAPERVLAHSDIAPDRKADPGEHFPWDVLARGGVGHWVEAAALSEGAILAPGEQGIEVATMQRQLAEYGYGLQATGVYDDETVKTVRAFQRHFRRSLVDGIADVSTRQTLAQLLAGLAASPAYSAAARPSASGS